MWIKGLRRRTEPAGRNERQWDATAPPPSVPVRFNEDVKTAAQILAAAPGQSPEAEVVHPGFNSAA